MALKKKRSSSTWVENAANAKNFLEKAVDELTFIIWSKARITKAKKSIAGFRLREGMPPGVSDLTVRVCTTSLGQVSHCILPCGCDFHGVSNKASDGRGN